MTTLRMSSIVAALVAHACAAQVHAQCGEGAGPCLQTSSTPGCIVIPCCEAVCKVDPQCCDGPWDQDCVTLAEKLCDGLTCPSPGACDAVHFNPGCEDTSCCEWACVFDPFCCFAQWDAICVEAATKLCDAAPCTIEIPAVAVDENEPCYKRLNDGCNMPDGVVIDVALPALRRGKHASGAPRDTDWYRFTLAAPARVRLEATAEFPSQLLLVRGPCLGPFETLAETHAVPCATGVVEIDLPAGTYSCVVSAGLPSRVLRGPFTCDEVDPKEPPPGPKDPVPEPSPYGLRYMLAMTTVNVVVGDLDGDGVVGQTDLAILLGNWGGAGLGDLDGDGTIGSPDLAILLGAWTG